MNIFKTVPFKHQRKALRLSQDAAEYALLMEQGTGKSKVVIDTVAHLWRKHKIDLVVIIAPKGVAPGWLRQQFPEHMPDDVEYVAALWKASLSRSALDRIRRDVLHVPSKLRIVIMNVEAFGATAKALDFVLDVLESAQSAMVVVDESHRIKTPGVHTTKRIVNLRNRCAYRRILTGTVGDSPFDLFSQFGFLNPEILEIDSFAAYKCEYAEMLPANHGLMRHITRRVPKKWSGKYIDSATGSVADEPMDPDGGRRDREMIPIYVPAIVAQNADGTPKYKNLDKLQKLIKPHTYRVLKKDCLDLPQKLYSRYYTELTDEQWSIYNSVRDEQRIEFEDHTTTFNKLTAILKLQQVVCGYVVDGGELRQLFKKWGDNPRIVSALECIDDRPRDEGTIIWCRFIEDIRQMTLALSEAYGARSVVQFYGETSDKDRAEAVARFQGVREFMDKSGNLLRSEIVPARDRARFIISQQRAGGVGQTWTAGNLSFHYSNSFSLIDRLQAEDRPHRIGQYHPVQYIDLESQDTVDSTIITSLIAKKEVADVINNDERLEWLR